MMYSALKHKVADSYLDYMKLGDCVTFLDRWEFFYSSSRLQHSKTVTVKEIKFVMFIRKCTEGDSWQI